jgi:hypothetical protein
MALHCVTAPANRIGGIKPIGSQWHAVKDYRPGYNDTFSLGALQKASRAPPRTNFAVDPPLFNGI